MGKLGGPPQISEEKYAILKNVNNLDMTSHKGKC